MLNLLLKIGYFPLVGWTYGEDVCFSLEAVDYNCGSLIQLGKSIGKIFLNILNKRIILILWT